MTPVDHNFIFFTEPHMHILASVVHCIKFECSLRSFFFFIFQPIAVSKGLFFLNVVLSTNFFFLFFFFVLVVLTMTVAVV